jgi:hypothetical protein
MKRGDATEHARYAAKFASHEFHSGCGTELSVVIGGTQHPDRRDHEAERDEAPGAGVKHCVGEDDGENEVQRLRDDQRDARPGRHGVGAPQGAAEAEGTSVSVATRPSHTTASIRPSAEAMWPSRSSVESAV